MKKDKEESDQLGDDIRQEKDFQESRLREMVATVTTEKSEFIMRMAILETEMEASKAAKVKVDGDLNRSKDAVRAETTARIEAEKKLATIREAHDLEREMYMAKIKTLQQEAERRKEEVEVKVEL